MRYLILILCFLPFIGFSQIQLVGNITTFGGGSYPTHIDSLGYGGLTVVADSTERNAITQLRRKVGMIVFQVDNSTLYYLVAPITGNNWMPIESDDLITLDTAQTTIYCPAHGITLGSYEGDFLPMFACRGAQADHLDSLQTYYAVDIPDVDSITIISSGLIYRPNHALSNFIGKIVYLTNTVGVYDTIQGTVLSAIAVVIDSNYIDLLPRSVLESDKALSVLILPASFLNAYLGDAKVPQDTAVQRIARLYASVGLLRAGGKVITQTTAISDNPVYGSSGSNPVNPAMSWTWTGGTNGRVIKDKELIVSIDLEDTSYGGLDITPLDTVVLVGGVPTDTTVFNWLQTNLTSRNLRLPNGSLLYFTGSGTRQNPDYIWSVMDDISGNVSGSTRWSRLIKRIKEPGGSSSDSTAIRVGDVANVQLYGALGNGSDATTAFQNAIASGKTVYIPQGRYLISSALTLQDGQTIYGDGDNSVVSVTANISVIRLTKRNSVQNFRIVGDKGGSDTAQYGIFGDGGASFDTVLENRITSMFLDSLGGAGIYLTRIVANHQGTLISDCVVKRNNYGIHLAVRGEYTKVTGCSVFLNTIGIQITGGNNNVSSCIISDNTTGVMVSGGDNSDHGVVSSCTINHNTTGVSIGTLAYGMSFIGNQLWVNTTNFSLNGCQNVHIVGGTVASGAITSTNATTNTFFTNVQFYPTVTKTLGTGGVYFVNNLQGTSVGSIPTSDGTYVLNVASRVHEWQLLSTAGAAVDSISVLQDSIIVGYSAGVETTRDTIGYPPGGGGGTVTGTGTTNKVAKFTGTSAIGDGTMSDDGTTVSMDDGSTVTAKPLKLDSWETANRPTGVVGITGNNTDNNNLDFYTGSSWESFAKHATGTGLTTATYVNYANANGRITGDALFTWNGFRLVLGNATGTGSISIGDAAGNGTMTGTYNIIVGSNAGRVITTGAANNFFGRNTGFSNTTGGYNNFYGLGAGYTNSSGNYNNFFGLSAGETNSTGSDNNFFGREAGFANTTGVQNHFYGFRAGRRLTTGNYNIGIGDQAFGNSTVGAWTGSTNVGIGRLAGDNIGGAASGNVIIGNQVDLPSGTSDNQLVISNIIFGTGASGTGTTISAGAKVGIKEAAPARDLHVAGELRVTDLDTDVPTKIAMADNDGDFSGKVPGIGLALASDGTPYVDSARIATQYDLATGLSSIVVNLSLTGTSQVIELTNSAGTNIVYKGAGIGLSKVAGTKDTLYFTRVEHWGEVSISGGSTAVTAAASERPDNDTPGVPTASLSSEFTQSGSTVTYIGSAGQLELTGAISFTTDAIGDYLVSLYQEGVELPVTEVRVSCLIGSYVTIPVLSTSVNVATNDTFDLRIEPVTGSANITVHRYNVYARKIY